MGWNKSSNYNNMQGATIKKTQLHSSLPFEGNVKLKLYPVYLNVCDNE
jgi:hypothetical protein